MDLENAYNDGYDDGHLTGEYANAYVKESVPDLWWAYRMGFERGRVQFNAEESVPFSEQIRQSSHPRTPVAYPWDAAMGLGQGGLALGRLAEQETVV